MGRSEYGTYTQSWTPPTYSVNESGKVVGGYRPSGPNNWGRWGEDDERGAANLVAAENIVAAAALVRRGRVFSLGLPIDGSAPSLPGRSAPMHFFTKTGSDLVVGSPHHAEPAHGTAQWSDDAILMVLQGSTQWDGLAHFAVEDTLYNGYWVGNVTGAGGAAKLGIEKQRSDFVGRAVLVDIARFLEVPSLKAGEIIPAATINDALESQGSTVKPGDFILLRTGYLSHWHTLTAAQEQAEYFAGMPGLSLDSIDWISAHDVAAVAADTIGVEVYPSEHDLAGPVHAACLVDLGVNLGELWNLDELAEDCAADGVYEFLLVAPPMIIPGAVGTPLNPIAIK